MKFQTRLRLVILFVICLTVTGTVFFVVEGVTGYWIEMIWPMAIVIASLLILVVSEQFVRGVNHQLEMVTQIAEDMIRQQFSHRIEIKGDNEITQMGETINRMADSLEKQFAEVEESKRQMMNVIESLESGLIMVDSQGYIKLANQTFGQMFALPVEDMIGKRYEAFLSAYNLNQLIMSCKEMRQPISVEIPLYYPQERILAANLTPLEESSGVGLVAVFRDLTAFRRLEQLRSDFVANVSHELKTPLTSIVGFTETLIDGASSDPDTCREFLQIIYKEGLRLQRLVTDLLDLSKIESKQLQMKMEHVSVRMLVQDVVKTMEEQIQSKGLQLVTYVEPLMVKVDTDCIRQVLVNLLANAMNYTPTGGEVTLTVASEPNHWLLQVTDTGIGIPENDQPRIFERFYRVDKARSRDSGGTGLGLAIVKHLVELHQGEIEVVSIVGEGSTFTIRFPYSIK
jgi:two-component system, OmpR family, phosphate regulon sensor histidine kinase PhoR